MAIGIAHRMKRVLFDLGYYRRAFANDTFPGVAVFCYHNIRAEAERADCPFEPLHVDVETFEGHCRLLRACCHPIGLDELHGALLHGSSLPARPVLVTFDDGYRNVLELGLPALRRHEIPAVMFVASGPSARRELYWFDAMARATTEAQVRDSLNLGFADHAALRQRYATAASDDPRSAPMTPAEVAEFAAAPGMEIGAHSVEHIRLATGSYDEQFAELARSKADLEGWIGKPVRTFAYPFGHPQRDFDATSIRAAFAAGFESAFSTESAFATRSSNPLSVSRFLMLDDIDAPELAHRLRHSWRRTPPRAS